MFLLPAADFWFAAGAFFAAAAALKFFFDVVITSFSLFVGDSTYTVVLFMPGYTLSSRTMIPEGLHGNFRDRVAENAPGGRIRAGGGTKNGLWSPAGIMGETGLPVLTGEQFFFPKKTRFTDDESEPFREGLPVNLSFCTRGQGFGGEQPAGEEPGDKRHHDPGKQDNQKREKYHFLDQERLGIKERIRDERDDN